MAGKIIEIPTSSAIPAFVPFGVLYYSQDTGTLYIGTGSSKGAAVNVAGAGYVAGLVGDNATDNTAAVNAALANVYAAGGGTLMFPPGNFRITGQITIPNDGSTTFNNSPLQPSIRITGSGAAGGLIPGGGGAVTPFGSGPAYGGTVLNMTFNASVGKLKTLGTGPLEIDHITFCDTGSDTAAFIYATNTTVNIHDCTFLGTAVGPTLTNDAIVLGGASTTPSGADNAPMQGYGSIITHCWFEKIRRALFGGSFCNSVFFTENTIWSSSGNNQAGNGAAIELGSTGQANGNLIANNLIEAVHYIYGIKVINGMNNKILCNDIWDPGNGVFSSPIRLDANAASNLIIGGINSPQVGQLIDDAGSGNSTVIAPRFGDPNIFSNPICVQLTATAALTAGQVVKLDTAAVNSVVVCTTTDTAAGTPVGVVCNSPGAGRQATVAVAGKVPSTQTFAPLLGTGSAAIGQFVVVDTTTNGRIKCTSTYTPGTLIGTALSATSTVGNTVGILLGLR